MLARRLLADPGLPSPNPSESYWQQDFDGNIANVRSQVLPTAVDVIIIGSGITGCGVVSRMLESDQQLSITILEARGVCSGATGRNGGHVKFNAVSDYAMHKAALGHERAAEVVRFSKAHYDAIASAAEQYGATEAGEVRKVVAIIAYMTPALAEAAQRDLKLFEDAFPKYKGEYQFHGPEETFKRFKLRHTHGCLSGPAGAAWPYRLISTIYRSLLSKFPKRFSMESFTPALEITRDAAYYSVRTPRGIIKTRHIVYCAEAHTSHLLPRLRGIIWPRVGQMSVHTPGTVLASQKGKYSWALRFASYFDYITQNAHTGEIFIGGGEANLDDAPWEVYANPSDSKQLSQADIHLSKDLSDAFDDPQRPTDATSRIKASWSGVMGFSIDGYPLVGRLPDTVTSRLNHSFEGSGEWIAAGFGGYGMVNSFLSGRAVAEMVLGIAPALLPTSHVLDQARYERLKTELERRIRDSVTSGEPEYKTLL